MEEDKNINENELQISGLNKWRLILGEYAAEQISYSGNDISYLEMEQLLDFLYSKEYGKEEGVMERSGGNEGSIIVV